MTSEFLDAYKDFYRLAAGYEYTIDFMGNNFDTVRRALLIADRLMQEPSEGMDGGSSGAHFQISEGGTMTSEFQALPPVANFRRRRR